MPTVSLMLFAVLCAAGEVAPPPTVWLMPPGLDHGRQWRELFARPEAWARTRARVAVLGFADHALRRECSDDELRTWFARMAEWKLKLGLEVGAIKPWGTTGEEAFAKQKPLWEHFRSLGADIHALAFDEPLCCARKLTKPDAYAVEETARFIQLVRGYDARIQLGDIEPYPFLSAADLIAFVDGLQARLAQLQVRGLDFVRLDVDWVAFTIAQRGSWREVRQVEDACRKRGFPFQLIYWASGQPALAKRKLAGLSTWYTGIMQEAADYALVGGRPDGVVIESWIAAPEQALPDSDPWTFTGAAADLLERFVPGP